jgi:hypothetical protein
MGAMALRIFVSVWRRNVRAYIRGRKTTFYRPDAAHEDVQFGQ